MCCNICMENEADKQLNCNHSYCFECFVKLNRCAYCRKQINKISDVLNIVLKEYTTCDETTYVVSFANYIFHSNEFNRNHFKNKINADNFILYNPNGVDSGVHVLKSFFKTKNIMML